MRGEACGRNPLPLQAVPAHGTLRRDDDFPTMAKLIESARLSWPWWSWWALLAVAVTSVLTIAATLNDIL
jgi:hypothetical protein